MSRGAKLLKLLASEDINGNKMNFGVAMLAGLGGGHINDFARAVLNDNKAVLPQGRALHGIGGGSASIGRVKSVLMLEFPVSDGWLDIAEYDGFEANAPNRQICMVGRVRGVAAGAYLGIVILFRHLI